MVGRVLTFDRRTGYGFIRPDHATPDDQDVFLHVSALPAALKDTLKAGDRVEFDPVASDQGLKASRVRLVTPQVAGGSIVKYVGPECLSPVEFGMAIAPALALVHDRATRSELSSRLLAVAREHGWVEAE